MAAAMATHIAGAPTRVVEVTAEHSAGDPPEIPWNLAPPPGNVALQLRTTIPRVLIGAGLARRPELVEAVRNLQGVKDVATSPAGGTFAVGGPGWLGLCAIGTLPETRGPTTDAAVCHSGGASGTLRRAPLDWMMDALRGWFAAGLDPLGVTVRTGRVEGAWCPGFSDIAAGGRKLAGLGFRVTRGMVVMRGVLATTAVNAADLAVLQACHRLIDLEVSPDALTSLAECTGDPTWDDARAIAHFRTVVS